MRGLVRLVADAGWVCEEEVLKMADGTTSTETQLPSARKFAHILLFQKQAIVVKFRLGATMAAFPVAIDSFWSVSGQVLHASG